MLYMLHMLYMLYILYMLYMLYVLSVLVNFTAYVFSSQITKKMMMMLVRVGVRVSREGLRLS